MYLIIDYKCAKDCFDTQACYCGAGVAKQTPYHKGTGHGFASKDGAAEHGSALKNKSVNYWLYVRENKKVTIGTNSGRKNKEAPSE